jgi:hypothetical protein
VPRVGNNTYVYLAVRNCYGLIQSYKGGTTYMIRVPKQ